MYLLEPGYYQDGEFGIRLEDVALVVEAKTKVTLWARNMDHMALLWVNGSKEGQRRRAFDVQA